MVPPLNIIRDLKSHLITHLGDIIKDVILFGSRSTGLAQPCSDFDILIILKTEPDWKLEKSISDWCYDIDLKYDIFTDVHLLSVSEIKSLRGKQPVFRNAILKGIYA
jgi:predicted nucleotidyltransferase